MIIEGKVVEIFQVPVDKDIWPSDFTEMAEPRIEVLLKLSEVFSMSNT